MMAAANKKLKFVILQQVNVISLLLLQILAAIENYQYSRIRILHMNCQIVSKKITTFFKRRVLIIL